MWSCDCAGNFSCEVEKTWTPNCRAFTSMDPTLCFVFLSLHCHGRGDFELTGFVHGNFTPDPILANVVDLHFTFWNFKFYTAHIASQTSNPLLRLETSRCFPTCWNFLEQQFSTCVCRRTTWGEGNFNLSVNKVEPQNLFWSTSPTWRKTSEGTHILDTSGTIMNFEWKARLNTWYLVGWTSHDTGCECNFNLGGLMLLVSLLLIGVGWTLKFRFLQMLWLQPQMILQWRCMIKTTTWVWFNFIGRRFQALHICKILKFSEDFTCPGLVHWKAT